MVELGRYPPISVDPGRHAAVVVVRRGQLFTFLRGGRDGQAVEKPERPKIKIPTPLDPPITARLVAMSVAETADAADSTIEEMLARDLGDAADVEIAAEFPPGWEEIAAETREVDAVPTTNERTLLIRVPETNAVDLDRFEETFNLAARLGASVLVKFV